MKKIISIAVVFALLACILCACLPTSGTDDNKTDNSWVKLDVEQDQTIGLGKTIDLTASKSDGVIGFFIWSSSDKSVAELNTLNNKCTVKGIGVGTSSVSVSVGNYNASVNVTVVDDIIVDVPPQINLYCDEDEIYTYESATLTYDVTPEEYYYKVKFLITSGEEFISIDGNVINGVSEGRASVVAYIDDYISNEIVIDVFENQDPDPYIGVSRVDFYSNYTPSTSNKDAYYRSLHGFISGDISPQDQRPTISSYQPKDGNLYVRNTTAKFSEDGNTYYVLDAYGNTVKEIYKDGGYVSLEDVAAYVFAFSDVPANYVEGKTPSPSTSVWGKYLRANHTKFSGDTDRYPYEPVLPRISGCGGDLQYYEIDIGTTGTDCDPAFISKEYNNGMTITRGAARIVYTKYVAYSYATIDPDERYVFYTYNHYNDFQEYLNYYGGWGEMFGNVTGGGKLSSKTDYNPTDYVPTSTRDFGNENAATVKFRVLEFVIPQKNGGKLTSTAKIAA